MERSIPARHFLDQIGGEEFAVLLPEFAIAEQLRVFTNMIISLDNVKIKITASFGGSSREKAGREDLDLLYSQADQALYSSKNNGRNTVTIFKTKDAVLNLNKRD